MCKLNNCMNRMPSYTPEQQVTEAIKIQNSLANIPDYLQVLDNGVVKQGGVFSIQGSFSGKWHCKYDAIIGFLAKPTISEALADCATWLNKYANQYLDENGVRYATIDKNELEKYFNK